MRRRIASRQIQTNGQIARVKSQISRATRLEQVAATTMEVVRVSTMPVINRTISSEGDRLCRTNQRNERGRSR
jgi:hypothetical protein